MALILGFNDGVYPRYIDEDPIINDDDRNLLSGYGLAIQPASKDRLDEEELLTYIALTRASQETVISFPSHDAAGRELQPSPALADIKRLFPALVPQAVNDAESSRESWDIQTEQGLSRRLIAEMRSRPPLAEDDSDLRSLWNSLYESVRHRPSARDAWSRMAASLRVPRKARLSRDSTGALWSGEFKASVSKLETYAACPFKFLAESVLMLEERATASLSATEIGQLYHLLLQRVFGTLAQAAQSLRDYDDQALRELLEREYAVVLERASGAKHDSGGRGLYLMDRMFVDVLDVLEVQRAIARCGRHRPVAVELPFGFPDNADSLPALSLQTDGGNRAAMRGFIDRVDLAGGVESGGQSGAVVIDYKRTRGKRLSLSEVWHGLSLQLIAYLLVLAEHGAQLTGGALEPIAGLYVSLLRTRETEAHPDEADNSAIPKSFRPRGLIRIDQLFMLEDPITSWGTAYAVYVKKDGSPGHIDKTDAAGREEFGNLLRHTQEAMERLVDEIFAGNMQIEPYRLAAKSPCRWCRMSSVCQFESGNTMIRRLPSWSRSQVFDALAEYGAGDVES